MNRNNEFVRLHMYKARGACPGAGAVPASKEQRVKNLNTQRRNSRWGEMVKRRSIPESTLSPIPSPSINNKKKEMLKKWQQEKEMRLEKEKAGTKPPFKVCHVTVPLFFDLDAIYKQIKGQPIAASSTRNKNGSNKKISPGTNKSKVAKERPKGVKGQTLTEPSTSGQTRTGITTTTMNSEQQVKSGLDSGASTVSWRLSPSSSGYKSQSQISGSVTPSATSTPNPSGDSTRQDPTPMIERDVTDQPKLWVVTDIHNVSKGSIIINPQTGQPVKNIDGSIYHYDPQNLPPGFNTGASSAESMPDVSVSQYHTLYGSMQTPDSSWQVYQQPYIGYASYGVPVSTQFEGRMEPPIRKVPGGYFIAEASGTPAPPPLPYRFGPPSYWNQQPLTVYQNPPPSNAPPPSQRFAVPMPAQPDHRKPETFPVAEGPNDSATNVNDNYQLRSKTYTKEDESGCSNWKPSEGWFLDPPENTEVSGQMEVQSSEQIREPDEGDAEGRSEVSKYNVCTTPLSPILEKSCTENDSY